MSNNVSLIDGHIEKVKSCENCVYYDNDRQNMPCFSCVGYICWIERERDTECPIKN